MAERTGDSLYKLRFTPLNAQQRSDFAAAVSSCLSIQLLHQRFGHVNCKDLKRTLKLNAVEGLDLDAEKAKLVEPCDGCVYGKMHRSPFPTEGHVKSENVGDLVHGDVGIVNVPTHDSFRFYSLFKDDFSEFSDVKLLKQKSEAALHVMEFCEMLHT